MAIIRELLESDDDIAALLISRRLNWAIRQNRVEPIHRDIINIEALSGRRTGQIERKVAAYLKLLGQRQSKSLALRQPTIVSVQL